MICDSSLGDICSDGQRRGSPREPVSQKHEGGSAKLCLWNTANQITRIDHEAD